MLTSPRCTAHRVLDRRQGVQLEAFGRRTRVVVADEYREPGLGSLVGADAGLWATTRGRDRVGDLPEERRHDPGDLLLGTGGGGSGRDRTGAQGLDDVFDV